MSGKKSIKRRVKGLPLQAIGVGMTGDQLRDATKEIESKVEKMGCCEQATLRVGLVMANLGLDLADLVQLQSDLNHLIHRKEDGKLAISKHLMSVMTRKPQ